MDTTNRAFVRTHLASEDAAVALLPSHGLLKDPAAADPCHKCGGEMRLVSRKRTANSQPKPSLRCRSKGCQTHRTVRLGFDHHTVCHKVRHVALDGTHTQSSERHWREFKSHVCKRGRLGAGRDLQGHCDEYAWRCLRKPQGPLFPSLLSDIASFQ